MQSLPRKIRVDVTRQRLELIETRPDAAADSGIVKESFSISTSRFGLGSEPGSFKTPLGRFRVGEMIGLGAEFGAIFKGRVPTGEIGPEVSPEDPADFVQTRILWLEGLEPQNANTRERYIYIHGTNHEEQIGEPSSHGCVRMRNADIVRLFDMVAVGTEVLISESL